MELKIENSEDFRENLKTIIVQLRRHRNTDYAWKVVYNLVENNPEKICEVLNTRWLISIADTYADFGNDIEKRNALYITMLGNFEKLFQTRMLMYDLSLNPMKVEQLKHRKVVPLWDGMTSFNIQEGNMTNNMFYRIREMLKATPSLEVIFETIMQRIAQSDTFLSDLNKHHKKLFDNPAKVSFITRNYRRIKKAWLKLSNSIITKFTGGHTG